MQGLNDVSASDYDLLHLCNGHDLCTIMSLSFKKMLGSYDTSECSLRRELEIQFILGI
jgi:hypothetical protein